MSTGNPAAITADPNDPAWLEARRTFLGASDVPAVLGLSPWSTALDVWAFKVGLIEGSAPTLATRLGHELEDLIARVWCEQHRGVDVRHAQVTVRHPDLPWLAASTDREVGDDGLLECKLVGGGVTDKWDDGVPLYVQAQCQVQLAVTGRSWVDVCSLHAGRGWDHRVHRIERDDQALLVMLPRLDEFWHTNVIGGVRPELDGDPWKVRDALSAMYPGEVGTPTVLTAEQVQLVDDLRRSKVLLKDLERDVKAAENELIAALGDATDAWGPDADSKPIVTYRPATRTGHDLKRLLAGDVDGVSPEDIAVAQRVLTLVETTSTYRTLRDRQVTARSVRHDFSTKSATGDNSTMTTTQPGTSLAEAVTSKPAASSAPAKITPKQLIRQAVDVNRREIENALPDGYVGGPERFARTVLTCVARDPKLLKCNPTSIIGAAMQAAQLGLTPGVLGEAWIVPYGDQATFQVGYRGLIALAARSGIVIQAHTVHQNDVFEYELGLSPQLRHVPAMGSRGPSVLWYAVAKDRTNGDLLGFAVIDREHVEKRRKSNRGASPAWSEWFDEMALTKAIREVCKFLPLSVEMATAVASDGAVRTEVAGHADEYVADFDGEVIDGEVLS